MSQLSLIEREKKRKKLYSKYFLKKQKIKLLIRNETSLDINSSLEKAFQKLPINSHLVRQRNRCAFTGRPRGFYRYFGLSRNYIKELMHHSSFSNEVKKSSW